MSVLRCFPAAVVTLVLFVLSTMVAHADGVTRGGRPDPYAYAPPSVDYDWTGIYVGGHVGASGARAQWTYGPFDTPQENDLGFAGGAHVGLQKQWEKFVIGAEVSYTWVDLEEESPSRFFANTVLTNEIRNLFTVAGKVGYASENALAYFKAGYATADVDFRSELANSGVITTFSSQREHGWVAALGIEYALRPNIIIGVEFDWVHLNAEGRTQVATPAGIAGAQVTEADIDVQTLVARLSFKWP
jgi:outer membrane immunogenic protein